MKQGSLVNNSYIFEPILILSTLFRSAVCPRKRVDRIKIGSKNVGVIYERPLLHRLFYEN